MALQQRVKGREDTQAKRRKVLVTVLLPELASHQVKEARVCIPNRPIAIQPQGHGLGDSGMLSANHPLLHHHIEYQITTLSGALWITQGVVQRGTFDHTYQQCLLVQPQLLQRRIEIMPCRQRKAMDGPRPFLAQVHFVEVALEYLGLVVMQLQQYRHHQFCQFAHNGAFGR